MNVKPSLYHHLTQITVVLFVAHLVFGCIDDPESFEASAPPADTTPDTGVTDTATPGDVSDTPGDVPDTPGDVSDAPGDVSDAPGDVPDTPGDVSDAPGDEDGGATDSEDDTATGCSPTCEAGESCEDSSDCRSEVCIGGVCQAHTCDDGVHNGDETDVDCGGPDCPPCATGDACAIESDCTTGLCVNGQCTAAASCQQLQTLGADLPSGDYIVDPPGNEGEAIEVHCDFEADGGVGYTMVRIDDEELTESQDDYRASCRALGMELIVPRTRAHAEAILEFNGGTPPNIVGVYPQFAGAVGLHNWQGRCQGEPCTFYMDDSDSAGCTGFEPSGDNAMGSALYRVDEGCFFGAWNDNPNNHVDLQGSVICSTNDAGPKTQNSCLDYRLDDAVHNAGPEGISGVYSLVDTSGDPYDAYCEMSTAGGGWTLSMKIDGHYPTFDYDAVWWTNDELLAPHAADLDYNQSKLQSFNDQSFSQLLVGLEAPFDYTGRPHFRWLPLAVEGASLQAVFDENEFVSTNAGRASWKGLVEGSSLQCNCNMEGLNVRSPDSTTHVQTRVGFIANNQQDCGSPDSMIGLGGTGNACGQPTHSAGHSTGCNLYGNYDADFLAGDTAGCYPNDGDRNVIGFGALFVRDIPVLESCQALYDEGITRSGVYPIAPDGDDPINAYCEMELAGGGWTLVVINGTDGRPFRWSQNDYPRPGASYYGNHVAMLDDVDAIQSGAANAHNYSIDAEVLFEESGREFLTFVGGSTTDYVTGELPAECNFFDGSQICEENTYTGLTVYDSDGAVVTDEAQACTTEAGLHPEDSFDEFGLHLVVGTQQDTFHCFGSEGSPVGHQDWGRIYTTFEGGEHDHHWHTGVHSHWNDDGELNQAGFLLLR